MRDESSAIRGFRADNQAWLFLERSYVTGSNLGDQEMFADIMKTGEEVFNPGQMTGWAVNNILSAVADYSSVMN